MIYKMKGIFPILFKWLLIFTVTFVWTKANVHAHQIIDAVVASVDGEPITLSDLCARLQPPRRLTLEEAAADTTARAMLDALIMEKLIEAEAASRKVSVVEGEVEAVIDRVAARNGLSRPQFENALRAENNSLDNFKRQIRQELLRQKLAASLAAGGISISDEDADEYIKNNPQLFGGGRRVELQQIFISTQNRDEEEALKLINQALEAAKQGADFGATARKFSEAPEAQAGGSLGTLAEADLSPLIFNAILHLQEGQHSEVVRSPAGYHIFRVVRRGQGDQIDLDKNREEAREILRREKLEILLKNYFTETLYKQHAVDKKW